MLETIVDEKYYSKNKIIGQILNIDEMKVIRVYGLFDTNKSKHQAGSVYSKNGLCPTLDTMQGGWRQPCIEDKNRIRKLTPKECWRLMGFDDEDFEKAKNIPTSNTQLYKQAGNSIVVKVLEKIFIELLNNQDKKNINNCYGKILENGQISIF